MMNYISMDLAYSDAEVRSIFRKTRCYYQQTVGHVKREADGIFVREQRTREGILGQVLRNPITGENWLWTISKKNRQPFALAKVN
jgi:hypothetical protein